MSSRSSVDLEVGERSIPVEVFEPRDGAANGAGVLVIHEMWGVNDDIRRIARRFADNGYVAAAPDLLADGPRIRCLMRAVQSLRNGDGDAVRELEAVIAMLGERPDVSSVGVAGFCFGGGFALLLACRESVAAAGVFYGDPANRERDDLARACPMVGGYGMKDRTLRGKAPRLVATLDELGKEHDIKLYPDAGHSYMNARAENVVAKLIRPIYHLRPNDEAAEDSWRRMLAFFSAQLRG
jgi:carboxymethylenebutenolidase